MSFLELSDKKVIIDGKLYNTETAKLIGERTYGCGCNESFLERLYKKENGEFFLNGIGNSLTHYATYCHGQHHQGIPGSKVIPTNLDDAKVWVEKHCSTEKYKELFGPVEE